MVSINDAALRPPEGWCHPHRFGSFAPPRGLTDDGSQAQWFVDGGAAFAAIAASIENAKSEVCHYPLQGLATDDELNFIFSTDLICLVDFHMRLVGVPRTLS